MGAGELQRSLPCFGAAVAEEDAVEAGDLGEAEGEFRGVLVEEEVRGVEELLRLARDGLFDCGMAVTEAADTDAAEEVEVVDYRFRRAGDTPSPLTKRMGLRS